MGDGSYELVAKHSGKCVDVTGASTAGGAVIEQWTCSGSSNQRWKTTYVAAALSRAGLALIPPTLRRG